MSLLEHSEKGPGYASRRLDLTPTRTQQPAAHHQHRKDQAMRPDGWT